MAQAVALGIDHPDLGQAVVLVVQPMDDAVTPDALADHCRAHLPTFMVPQAVRLRAELPRNANGKIDRRTLRDELAGLFTNEETS